MNDLHGFDFQTASTASGFVRGDGARPSRSGATPLQAVKARFDGLTAREREVALQVAEGKSNRQIARELVLSERTVEAHISNILSKLELTSRTQVVVWAIRKGLAGLAT